MHASRSTRFALRALGAGLAACFLCACETSVGVGTNADAEYLSGPAIGPSPQPERVASSTLMSREDEPMTLLERRRLMDRVRQDPRTINRLTPRERRELAGMVAATKRDNDDRD